MATRILGPRTSWRRRRFLLAPIFLMTLVALFVVTGAQAVHDTGTFQLDGDASSATQPIGPAATDDWDKVCHQYASPLPTGGCGTSSDTTGSTVGSWGSDGALNSTIFVGGGSKDPQFIGSWAWKDEAGGLPDKDNILHAFAARYSLPADRVDTVPPGSGDLGNGTACPAGTFATCEVIYFGLDRFDNSGDAQNGFWFLQSRIGLGTNKIGGATGFTGEHVNGDLLVISDFSNGGAVATITIHKWDTSCTATNKPDPDCADANLRQLETSTAAKCSDTLSAGDAFCGIVNPADGTAVPWSGNYTDKSGNHSYLQGEFYEAGINLSLLGLAGECFSSFVSETRSSTSTTATLKDFQIGNFAQCKPTMTTQASATVANPVLPGSPVTDRATILVTGGANPPDPTGGITFYLCGPIATGDCGTSGGTQVGTTAVTMTNAQCSPVSPNSTDGKACAISLSVNDSAQTGFPRGTLAPGRYCFRTTWPGDSNYATPLNVTNDSSECFRVQDTSSVATHQIWRPNDRATVTSTGGTALNGTVKFELYTGNNCGATSGTKIWPTAGDPAGTGEFTLANAASPATAGPTNNTSVTVEADATVSWKVTFTSSDTGVADPATFTCEVTTLDLTPNQ
jgi:hypothetical protein